MPRKTEPGAAAYLPKLPTLTNLRSAAKRCHGCDLYQGATQTVFGAGSQRAQIMFVGEQPGNEEDLQGAPFVGPAGRIFDKALEDAGIARESTYVTNAVKHFKYEPRGKRRIHKRPNTTEIVACRPWLKAELDAVKPRALMCLGATAAQSLLGKTFRVSQARGHAVESDLAPVVMATVHPSSLLRAPSSEDREREYSQFVADLRALARAVANKHSP
jgi:uracil-DNA glycosylase family protein